MSTSSDGENHHDNAYQHDKTSTKSEKKHKKRVKRGPGCRKGPLRNGMTT